MTAYAQVLVAHYTTLLKISCGGSNSVTFGSHFEAFKACIFLTVHFPSNFHQTSLILKFFEQQSIKEKKNIIIGSLMTSDICNSVGLKVN